MSAVRVGLVGFDDRERFGLGLAFRHHSAVRYEPGGEPADILVVDGDGVGAPEALVAALADGSARGVVLLTLARHYDLEPHPTLRVLRKPVANRDILAALDDLAAAWQDGGAGPVAIDAPSEEPPVPDPAPPPPAAAPPGPASAPPAPDAAPPASAPPAPEAAPPGAGPGLWVGEPVRRSGEAGLLGRVSLRQAAAILSGSAVAEIGERVAVPVGAENERYAPADHLDGAVAAVILLAHTEQRPVALVADSDSLLYDPRTRQFTSSSYFDWLDGLAAAGVPCGQFIVTDPVDVITAESARRPADQVLWRAALLSSAGRLRAGIDRTAPSALAYWPDLAHLDLVDGMIQIVAAVSASSLSVEELVAAGHPRPVVNATLSALAAVEALMVPPSLRRNWLPSALPDRDDRRSRRRFRRTAR